MEASLVTEAEWRIQEQRRRSLWGQICEVVLALEAKTPDAVRAGEPGAPGAVDVAPERVATPEAV